MKLTKAEFLKLLASARSASATVENAIYGFCATGLFPFDRTKINSDAFLPSKKTERQLPTTPYLTSSSRQHMPVKIKGIKSLIC